MVRKEKGWRGMGKRRLWLLLTMLLLGILLTGWACAGAEGADGDWPPAGKTEVENGEWTILLVYNHAGLANGEYLTINYNGNWEDVTAGTIKQISGDTSYSNALSLEEEPDGMVLRYHPETVSTSGVGSFLVNMESEHCYTSQTIHVHFVDFEGIGIHQKQDTVTCLVGDKIDGWELGSPFFLLEGDLSDFYVGTHLMDVNAAGYRIDNGILTAKREGDFTVPVTLVIGSNSVEFKGYRLALHVVSQETAEAEWKASWPPAGKEEGCLNVSDLLEGVYVSHYADREDVQSFSSNRWVAVSPGTEYDYSTGEDAVKSHVAFASGDERLKEVFTADGNSLDFSGLSQMDADGAVATFRIDAESEHYYASAEFTITAVNLEHITAELTTDVFPTKGKILNVYDMLQGDTVRISPEMNYYGTLRNEAGDYGESVETDQYAIEWGSRLTVKEKGQYPLYLYLALGRNAVTVRKPITIEAEVIAGEAIAEVAGEGGASLDQNLELKLDNGDGEYTIYAGGTNNHIGFWDIVDYDSLKAAWGGEPGWSIQPAEGSEDILRWSNASLDGKSMWAFGRNDDPAVAGDYEGVLTCTWHGQTASANIRVHVIDSPTGALEGISGIEEAYTMKVGETLDLNPQTNPEGWAPPEGRFELTLSYLHCITEDEYSYEQSGDPYFHILLTKGEVGPVSLTALKSGEYEIGFNAQATNFRVAPQIKITVQNADGTVPATAAEMQDAPESVLAALKKKESDHQYEQLKAQVEDNGAAAAAKTAFFQYEETYGGIAIKKIIPREAELVIPATLDGKKVVSISYNALDPTAQEGVTISSLVVEEGVERIETAAFHFQKNLKRVWLPDSLDTIGSSAFESCVALTEIRLPSTIRAEQIQDGAFRRTGMESLFLPDGTDLMDRALEQYLLETDSRVCMSAYAEPYEYLVAADNSVTIIDYSGYSEETLSVPREINGKPVKAIGREAFAELSRIRKVIMPEGLQEIGEKAFYGCTALEEVTIPSTVKVIGSKAFAKVAAAQMTLPEGVTGAAEDWFAGPERTDSTGKWKYLILPNGTAELTEYEYTETMEFPSEVDGYTVTAIQASENGRNRSNVKKIILPDTLKVIGRDAFPYTALTEVALPEGLERIEKGAFYNVKLKQLTLPESLVFIGDEAFADHEIDELVFPAGLKAIGNAAFNGRGEHPSKVTFKGFATELGKGIFGYSMSSFSRDDPRTWRDFYVAKTTWKVNTISLNCYPGSTADLLYQANVKKKYLEWGEENIRTAPVEKVLQAGLYGEDALIFEIIVPEGVEEIAEGAFRGMRSLIRITLPSTLKTIGAGAFEECSGLKEISLPESVAIIPSNAFKGCISLSNVSVGKEGLIQIGDSAFHGCQALTDLKLGKRLTEIGEYAFVQTGLKKAKLPDTVTKIGRNAFAASKITSLTLPKGMTEIPDEMCFNAGNLKTVTFPKGLTTIGSYAFYNCPLSKLTLPEGLKSVGEGAFKMDEEGVNYYYYWSKGKKHYASLKSLQLPSSLEAIGKQAFACQDALTGITFGKSSKLQEIGDGAFGKCINLKELKLPNSLESIGAYAFINCVGLKKVNLGSGVKSIGDNAFEHDSSMTGLTVPDSLTEIGQNILGGHGNKLTVTCGACSAMETWLQSNAPEITVKHPKQK